ncbi:MAG: response regulator [Ginsengibacter sp.]
MNFKSMYRLNILICIFLLTCFSTQAQNNTPVPVFYEVKPNEPLQPLQNYLLVAEDKKHTWTISDILSGKANKMFAPLTAFKNIDRQSTWWCKLIIHANFNIENFFIGLQKQKGTGIAAGNEVMNAWIIKNGVIENSFSTGTLTPASARIINHPFNSNLFPFEIQQNETKTLFLQIQSVKDISKLKFNFALQHKDLTDRSSAGNFPVIIFYAGVMFILFLFGLVFSFITRERSFYWFTLVALFYLLHSLLLHPDNLLTQWFFPDYPVLMIYAWTILTYVNVIFYWQFGRQFTQLNKVLPAWDIVVRFLIGFISIAVLINIFSSIWIPFSADKISRPASIIIFLTAIVLSVRFVLNRNPQVKIFGIAACWLFLFQVAGVLWETGLLPRNIPNPWITAQFGTMVIIFFALAYRFKKSAMQQAEANQVLQMDKIKSRFFANISHEFRTPLTLMLGPLKQLEENNIDGASQRKYFGMMRRNGERLLQLINQLLDLSKLEGGKMELHVAKTDITGLLKVIAASFESLAEQKQVNYHVHFPEENIVGFIDRDKIEKVLVNLLSNAFHFTPANGNVSLHVSADENRLRFSVQDNGTGIAKEQLDKIFDRFHQVAGTEGGTGIGLSLAKELVQLHKGQISVNSELGRGSTFRVSVSIAKESYTAGKLNEMMEQADDSKIFSFDLPAIKNDIEEIIADNSLPSILIVEDNTDLRQFIKDILSKEFKTTVAANGKIGLAKAKEIIPDLIISDVMMPGMDGIEMTQQLKQEAATSHIPVIILTAKAGSSSKIEGLQTGADDYLVKPFDANELIVRCKNLIEQRVKLRALFSKQVISITPSEIEAENSEKQFLEKIRNVIEENLDNELFSVVDLSNAVFMSRSQLHRKLKALTGEAPNELIRNFRLERALQLLQKNAGNVTEIAFMTGFSSPAYFSKCFSDRYSYSPVDAKKFMV